MGDRHVLNEVGPLKVSKPLLRWRMRLEARESPVLNGRGVVVGRWRSTRAEEGSTRSSAADARARFRLLGPLHPRLVRIHQPGTVGQPLERSTRLLPLEAVR
jgi:hypothetical protein